MMPALFVALVLAGGAGASVRYVLDGMLKARTSASSFPWSTAIINLTGSPVMGFLTGLVGSRIASTEVSVVLGTGFLGGYTTFSAASYETVHLIRQNRYGLATLYGVGVLVLGVALAFLGYHYASEL